MARGPHWHSAFVAQSHDVDSTGGKFSHIVACDTYGSLSGYGVGGGMDGAVLQKVARVPASRMVGRRL
eukprot:1074340-Alexandrium_andersonii.AAC.1